MLLRWTHGRELMNNLICRLLLLKMFQRPATYEITLAGEEPSVLHESKAHPRRSE